MGTNYYWHEKPPCVTCGRSYGDKHIGKSSCGWVFSLHIYPEDGINDLPDWERLWTTAGSSIYDEYGKAVSIDEMRSIITERGVESGWRDKPWGYDSWNEFHRVNDSMKGPRGLLRARRAIRQGTGTWDCHVGDFS